jgi:hypothetical protein
MAESFFDKVFGKKSKKDEKPPPAPTPPPAAAADAANGLKFLANPKKATNKRVEDAEKAAGMKCGGKVKKLAFGGLSRSLPAPAPGARPMMAPVGPSQGGPMPVRPQTGPGPRQMPGRPPIDVMRSQPGGRAPMMKKGGSVRGGGCATKGIGKGKMR